MGIRATPCPWRRTPRFAADDQHINFAHSHPGPFAVGTLSINGDGRKRRSRLTRRSDLFGVVGIYPKAMAAPKNGAAIPATTPHSLDSAASSQ